MAPRSDLVAAVLRDDPTVLQSWAGGRASLFETEFGVPSNSEDFGDSIRFPETNTLTLLQIAAASRSDKCLRLLLDEVDSRPRTFCAYAEPSTGLTALMLFCIAPKRKFGALSAKKGKATAKALLAADPGVLDLQDRDGYTALMHALAGGSSQSHVDALINAGANLRLCEKSHGWTALHFAARYVSKPHRMQSIVDLAKRQGASSHTLTRAPQRTPLSIACRAPGVNAKCVQAIYNWANEEAPTGQVASDGRHPVEQCQLDGTNKLLSSDANIAWSLAEIAHIYGANIVRRTYKVPEAAPAGTKRSDFPSREKAAALPAHGRASKRRSKHRSAVSGSAKNTSSVSARPTQRNQDPAPVPVAGGAPPHYSPKQEQPAAAAAAGGFVAAPADPACIEDVDPWTLLHRGHSLMGRTHSADDILPAPETSAPLADALAALLASPQFADIRLRVRLSHADDVKDFPLHRVVLAARSPFLHRQLTRSAAAAAEGDVSPAGVLELAELEPDGLQVAVRYMYTSALPSEFLSPQALLLAFHAAQRLELDPLSEHLRLLIPSVRSAETMGLLLACSAKLGLTNVYDELLVFACAHAEQLVESQFGAAAAEVGGPAAADALLPYQVVRDLLQRDDFACSAEISVFEATWRFLAADWKRRQCDEHSSETRRQQIDALLEHVRLPLISQSDIRRIRKYEPAPFDSEYLLSVVLGEEQTKQRLATAVTRRENV